MTPSFKAVQMNYISPFNRKVITIAGVAGVAIVMFDDILNLAIWLFHNLIELLHTLFEMVELALDRSVEHLFHTGLHATQVIVFYIMLGFALWAGYKLWYGLPHWYKRLLSILENFWNDQKFSAFYDWETQSLLQKIASIIFLVLCVAVLYYFYL